MGLDGVVSGVTQVLHVCRVPLAPLTLVGAEDDRLDHGVEARPGHVDDGLAGASGLEQHRDELGHDDEDDLALLLHHGLDLGLGQLDAEGLDLHEELVQQRLRNQDDVALGDRGVERVRP